MEGFGSFVKEKEDAKPHHDEKEDEKPHHDCKCTFPYNSFGNGFNQFEYGCRQDKDSTGEPVGKPWCEYHDQENDIHGWAYCGEAPEGADHSADTGYMGDHFCPEMPGPMTHCPGCGGGAYPYLGA